MKLSRALLATVVSGLLPDDFFDDTDLATQAKPAIEKVLTFKEKINVLAALENLSEKARL